MTSGHSGGKAKLRVLAVLEGVGPSAVLTVIKPLSALHCMGAIRADITLTSLCSAAQFEKADVVVFSRNTDLSTLNRCIQLNKPFIYNIDDNPFAATDYVRWDLSAQLLRQFEHYLQSAHLVRIYSEPMRERALRLNNHVVRVDGPVDWSVMPATRPRHDPERVRIVYATGRYAGDPFLRIIADDLRDIVDAYGNRISLCFFGHHPPEFRNVPQARFLDYIPNYDKFFRKFAGAGFDIGLAPLYNDEFCRSKTNNKFREYGACRIAGVYSDMDVYAECVEDGRTGLLVPNERGKWASAIGRLIEEPELRHSIQEQAFAYTRTRYSMENMQEGWLHHIEEVVQRAKAPGYGSVARPVLNPAATREKIASDLPEIPPGGGGSRAKLGKRLVQVRQSVAEAGVVATLQRIYWSLYRYVVVARTRFQLSALKCMKTRRASGRRG